MPFCLLVLKHPAFVDLGYLMTDELAEDHPAVEDHPAADLVATVKRMQSNSLLKRKVPSK